MYVFTFLVSFSFLPSFCLHLSSLSILLYASMNIGELAKAISKQDRFFREGKNLSVKSQKDRISETLKVSYLVCSVLNIYIFPCIYIYRSNIFMSVSQKFP